MNGFVWLVGAGPGDPDLLTVKAARLLATADVVVHDALVGDGVLELVPPSAELIDVGKRPGRPVPQELISTLLVELARGGQRVVRLKGGDPFVFGRGGEEAQTLLDAGVPFEVVPGITSAVAAPAAAGIPVTHRGVAAAVTVVTGHRRAGEPDVDWRSLAKVGGTVVVLMGVSQRGTIAAELIEGGLDPSDAGRRDPVGDDARSGDRPVPARRAGDDRRRVAGRAGDRAGRCAGALDRRGGADRACSLRSRGTPGDMETTWMAFELSTADEHELPDSGVRLPQAAQGAVDRRVARAQCPGPVRPGRGRLRRRPRAGLRQHQAGRRALRRGGQRAVLGGARQAGCRARRIRTRSCWTRWRCVGHLVARDSVHWFLAEHRQRLFPDDMFADLFAVGSGPAVGARPM